MKIEQCSKCGSVVGLIVRDRCEACAPDVHSNYHASRAVFDEFFKRYERVTGNAAVCGIADFHAWVETQVDAKRWYAARVRDSRTSTELVELGFIVQARLCPPSGPSWLTADFLRALIYLLMRDAAGVATVRSALVEAARLRSTGQQIVFSDQDLAKLVDGAIAKADIEAMPTIEEFRR